MTDTDLRQAAERATQPHFDSDAWSMACDPQTILSLLDELERERSALKECLTGTRELAVTIADLNEKRLAAEKELKVFEDWKRTIEDSGDKDGWADNVTHRIQIVDLHCQNAKIEADLTAAERDAALTRSVNEQLSTELQAALSPPQELPRPIVELIYRETCCKPTPEQAQNEPCACVAVAIVERIEEWCAARCKAAAVDAAIAAEKGTSDASH